MEDAIRRHANNPRALGAWLRALPTWQRLNARLALSRILGASRAHDTYCAILGGEHPLLQPSRHGGLQRMEAAFGMQLEGVTVHPDSSVATEAGAVALARGTEIHFAPGQYDPETPAGERLLAHELAHVLQQSEHRVAPTHEMEGRRFNDDPRLEREADRQAEQALERLDGYATGAEPLLASSARLSPSIGTVAQKTDRLREVLDEVAAGLGDRGIDQQMHLGLPALGYVLAGMRETAVPSPGHRAHPATTATEDLDGRYRQGLFLVFNAIWLANSDQERRAWLNAGLLRFRPLRRRAEQIRSRLGDATLYSRLQESIRSDIDGVVGELRALQLPPNPGAARDASRNLGEDSRPIQSHGASIEVRGANALERQLITATLDRMPPAHVRAMPQIVLGGTAGRGRVREGGNTVARDGETRVELTHSSFIDASQRGFSRTLMHEMGHVAARAFGLTAGIGAEDLGNVTYGGVNRQAGGDARGGTWERWANAYQRYFEDPSGFARRDRAAARSVERSMRRAVREHGTDQVPEGWHWQFAESNDDAHR